MFSKVILPFFILFNNVIEFQFFQTLYKHLGIVSLINSTHFYGYVVVSLFGFNSHFPKDIEHLFIHLFVIRLLFVYLCWRICSNLLPIFKSWIVLLLNCIVLKMCILDTNLYQMCILKIFLSLCLDNFHSHKVFFNDKNVFWWSWI